MGPIKSDNASVNEKMMCPSLMKVNELIIFTYIFLPFGYILAVDSKCRLCFAQGYDLWFLLASIDCSKIPA